MLGAEVRISLTRNNFNRLFAIIISFAQLLVSRSFFVPKKQTIPRSLIISVIFLIPDNITLKHRFNIGTLRRFVVLEIFTKLRDRKYTYKRTYPWISYFDNKCVSNDSNNRWCERTMDVCTCTCIYSALMWGGFPGSRY